MGIVLWEIVARKKPFSEPEDEAAKTWTLRDKIIKGKRPPIPVALDYNYQQLMTACWDTEPKKRPTASMAHERLQHMSNQHPAPECRPRKPTW